MIIMCAYGQEEMRLWTLFHRNEQRELFFPATVRPEQVSEKSRDGDRTDLPQEVASRPRDIFVPHLQNQGQTVLLFDSVRGGESESKPLLTPVRFASVGASFGTP